jgi:hypothetical protein
MLDTLFAATVSRRPLASVLAIGAMSVISGVMLTACEAQAEQHAARPMPAADAPAASAVLHGQAAMRDWPDAIDPSHAAIASYQD